MNNTLKRDRIFSYTLMRDTEHRTGEFEATTLKLVKRYTEMTFRSDL